jgi:hypothetical protein
MMSWAEKTCGKTLALLQVGFYFRANYPTLYTASIVVNCDKCNHDTAYFYQLQIRSADEPMTNCESFSSLHSFRRPIVS